MTMTFPHSFWSPTEVRSMGQEASTAAMESRYGTAGCICGVFALSTSTLAIDAVVTFAIALNRTSCGIPRRYFAFLWIFACKVGKETS